MFKQFDVKRRTKPSSAYRHGPTAKQVARKLARKGVSEQIRPQVKKHDGILSQKLENQPTASVVDLPHIDSPLTEDTFTHVVIVPGKQDLVLLFNVHSEQ